MPIKLPKGFQRRKSSGNALDELQNPPSSSFRVIERPGNEKSFDGGAAIRSAGAGRASYMSRNSYDNEGEDLFSVRYSDANNRGSGGTENSLSTVPYDSGASSTRLSTSTNPSSIDARSDRNVQAYKDIPVPPPPSARPGFLRNSARTFSLGLVKDKSSSKATPGSSPAPSSASAMMPGDRPEMRSRAATASSASTATPPRLFDSDLDLDSSELDGFGNMFDGIGAKSNVAASPAERRQQGNFSSSPPNYPPTSYYGASAPRPVRAPAPRPIATHRNNAIESSPYSSTSHDGLMRSPSPSRTITQASPQRSFAAPAAPLPQSPSSNRTSMFGRKPVNADRMRLVQDHELDRVPTKSSTAESFHSRTTKVPSHEDTGLSPTLSQGSFDSGLAEHAGLAAMYQDIKPTVSKIPSNNKIMTPAQFERYKKQQEEDRRFGVSRDSDSEGEADEYEDDDDAEREKEATKKRRKQEAHLAVYRQQMMKVTGEQAGSRSGSALGTSVDRLRLSGGSELDNRLSHLTVSTGVSGKSSGDDGEEDEDVPLGILAAHGFPNKQRPPTQLSSSTSIPNLRTVSQSQPVTPSVAGDKRGSVPVFARQLPQDPYYGASLVNQANREAFSMHNGSSANLLHSSGASTAHPLHPSGLVGVIAGEEKARAMRRGSPNAQGNYEMPPPMHPGMMRSQTTGNLSQAGYPGMMPPMPMTPGDQAQIQMSHQMNQMMQMQAQWMQQMSQMMGGQANGAPSMPMPPGMMTPGGSPNLLAPPDASMGRPLSVQFAPGSGQRSMSTLSPSMSNWNASPNGNYAPSLAPSERSNVGLASRYRPVSTVPEPEPGSNRRASTFSSSTPRPFSTYDNRNSSYVKKPSVSPVGRKSPLHHNDEDEDEQGWAEMKAKKEKKQKNWKLRKGQNALQELYNGTA